MNKRNSHFAGTLEKVQLQASSAVAAIDAGHITLDDALDRMPEENRRIHEHLLTLVYRYRKIIRASWRKFCRKEPDATISALLDTALTQCRFQDAVVPQSVVNVAVTLARSEHADKFVNAVLRKALQEEFCEPEAPEDILPDVVLARWKKEFSAEEISRFAKLFLARPDFSFRLCNGASLPGKCREVPGFGSFRFGRGKPELILNSAEFARGDYYIQDPATSLSVSLAEKVLPECRKMLDICAAPGGKTMMAAELLPAGAEITASDISEKRQKLTEENFKLRNINARVVTSSPEKLTGEYDFVIADLPCSNSGVFRRRPDALWRFDTKALREVMLLQSSIVKEALRLTVPGGYILLSTCSIEDEENNALLQNPALEVISQKLLLPELHCDGAFAALCRKVDR